MATTAGYHHPSRGLKSGTKVLVKRVVLASHNTNRVPTVPVPWISLGS